MSKQISEKANIVGQTFLSVIKDNLFNELKINKRHLPHWQLKGYYYFITFRTKNNILLDAESINTVQTQIIDGNIKFYHLVASVVLNDHVHLIIRPNEGYEIGRILKGIKGVSAKKINKLLKTTGSIWQAESFDRLIRDADELNEKINYMYKNPLKRGFAENVFTYSGWFLNVDYDKYLE